ncbi:MAG: YcaO-like family protein [Candidatus Moranbacteria bacterium]|nr:YcaO-like family protein [Candidatus Moranbacteria bacterium]
MGNNAKITGDSDFAGQYKPHESYSLISEKVYLEDLFSKQPGGYRLPLPLIDRVRLQMMKIFREQRDKNEVEKYIPLAGQESLSPYWRVILGYLYRAGVIETPILYYGEVPHDEPKIYTIRLVSKIPGDPFQLRIMGRGVSFNFNEAISKLVGELLERYYLIFHKGCDVIKATVAELKERKVYFLDPFDADNFSLEQKKNTPHMSFTEHSRFRWVEGFSLMKKCKAFIPAQMVYWYYRVGDDEPRLQSSITNGAAGMFTREGAILSGLYELIQRDTFLLYWLCRVTPEKLVLPAHLKNPKLQKIVSDTKRYNLEMHILELHNDFGVPVIIVVLIDRSGRGAAVTMGGGCGPDREECIMRAYCEALSIRYWLRLAPVDTFSELPNTFDPFTAVPGQNERVLHWGNKQMLQHIEFFISGSERLLSEQPVEGQETQAELSNLIEKFKEKGPTYDIFFYEAKQKALSELGYYSVSVSVPALLPLYMNERFAPLGAERLRDFFTRFGKGDGYNPIPHPFP